MSDKDVVNIVQVFFKEKYNIEVSEKDSEALLENISGYLDEVLLKKDKKVTHEDLRNEMISEIQQNLKESGIDFVVFTFYQDRNLVPSTTYVGFYDLMDYKNNPEFEDWCFSFDPLEVGSYETSEYEEFFLYDSLSLGKVVKENKNSLHKALNKKNKLDKVMSGIYSMDAYQYRILREFFIEDDSEVVVITQTSVTIN